MVETLILCYGTHALFNGQALVDLQIGVHDLTTRSVLEDIYSQSDNQTKEENI